MVSNLHLKPLIGYCAIIIALSACASGPERRSNQPIGPLSAGARNKLAADNPQTLLRTAAGFERAGQYPSALQLYQQLAALHPGLTNAHLGIARSYRAIGQSALARRKLAALFDRLPDNQEVQIAYVRLLLDEVATKEALAVLESIQARQSLRLSQKLQLGIVYEIEGNSDKARLIWEEARLIKASGSRATKYMALSFALDEAYEAAVAIVQPLLNNPDTIEEGRLTLATIYGVSGQRDAALTIAESVLPYDKAQQRAKLYELLPRMTRAEKASALFIDRVAAETIRRLTDTRSSP